MPGNSPADTLNSWPELWISAQRALQTLRQPLDFIVRGGHAGNAQHIHAILSGIRVADNYLSLLRNQSADPSLRLGERADKICNHMPGCTGVSNCRPSIPAGAGA
jgi:hypothetical protein